MYYPNGNKRVSNLVVINELVSNAKDPKGLKRRGFEPASQQQKLGIRLLAPTRDCTPSFR